MKPRTTIPGRAVRASDFNLVHHILVEAVKGGVRPTAAMQQGNELLVRLAGSAA